MSFERHGFCFYWHPFNSEWCIFFNPIHFNCGIYNRKSAQFYTPFCNHTQEGEQHGS